MLFLLLSWGAYSHIVDRDPGECPPQLVVIVVIQKPSVSKASGAPREGCRKDVGRDVFDRVGEVGLEIGEHRQGIGAVPPGALPETSVTVVP